RRGGHRRHRQRARAGGARRDLGACRPAGRRARAKRVALTTPAVDGRPDLRADVHTGARTYVVGSRQVRPNLPEAGCPFCPGGLEAPEPYDVRWFPNRWPAMPDGRCEMILYTPQHDATFWSLGRPGARKI